jgi:Gram-negative bacterial TonB protein C-terminal
VERVPMYRGWWDSLKVLLSRVGFPLSKNPTSFFRMPRRRRMSGRSFIGSVILHCSFILLLIYLPQVFPPEEVSLPEVPQTPERIFYRIPVLDSSKDLPRIAPAGVGGRPGNASQPAPPALGSTALFANLIVVSKPVRPDNSRQTIWQRNSPPDIRIPNETKLPIIAIGNPDIPKPPNQIAPHDSKPVLTKKNYARATAPSEPEANAEAAILPIANPTIPRPEIPIATGGPSKPLPRNGSDQAAPVAPDIQGRGDPNLLVIGVDPAAAVSKVALPAGNRWGEFSASPAGTKPGSPGGSSNADKTGGASGAEGPGGDASVGIGAGKSGGGGDSSESLPVSLTGRNTAPAGYGALSSLPTEELIVPVITTPHVRKNALVVSGGPIGGGGLGVYKALNCGRVYTVFVTMPGTNWSLEYCPHSDSAQPSIPATASTVVHLEQPVLPPDATVKFDFLRLPVSEDKRRKFIVLKGFIDENGAVSNVQVYNGLLPAMDEAARTAFSRWKFMPALRDGKPVAVDILVGILPTAPASR